MNRGWWYRFVFLLVIVSVSILMIVPTVFKFDEDSSYPIKSKISLGLDLQGGLYMILGIDFNRVYRDEIKGYARKIEYLLKDNEIKMEMGELDSEIADDARHSLTITNPDQVEDARDKIKSYFGSILRLTKMEGSTLQYALGISVKKRIEEQSKKLANYETIKKFRLMAKPFTQEGGEITPTLKLKRKQINEKFKALIETMYHKQ